MAGVVPPGPARGLGALEVVPEDLASPEAINAFQKRLDGMEDRWLAAGHHAQPTAEQFKKDPENRLLQHAPQRRLSAEEIRDAILAVSGTLDRRAFGPPVPVHLTEHMQGRGRPSESGPLDGAGRRSLSSRVPRLLS